MRDLVVFSLFIVILPLSFVRPWLALCAFNFLGFNRTQDLTWGFARGLPIAQSLAIAALFGYVVWEFRAPPLRDKRVIAMVLMFVFISISIVMNPLTAWGYQSRKYFDLLKVLVMTLIGGALLINRMRLRQFMAVIALGLGFFGFKNGVMLMLGSRSIIGPGGMISDNNDLALALSMNIPLLYYLADDMLELPYGKYIRRFMKATAFMSVLAVISTGSRGGFLTMSFIAFLIALKSKWKVPAIATLVTLGFLGIVFAPQDYKDRISTMFTTLENQDASVQGRLTAWKICGRMIQANPLWGIGMNRMLYEYEPYGRGLAGLYKEGTNETDRHVAHNSYLQLWAESGTLAYLSFMIMLVGTIIGCQVRLREVRRPEARRDGDDWLVPYLNAIQVSLLGFMVGGTFLNRAHFDMTYTLVIAFAAMPVVLANERLRLRKLSRRPGPRLADEVWVRHGDPFVRVDRT